MYRMTTDPEDNTDELASKLAAITEQPVIWRKFAAPGLDLDYTCLMPRAVADSLMHALERCIEYMPPEKARIRVYGKWHQIPRQQAAFGDPGLTYSFSGIRVDAERWPEVLLNVRSLLQKVLNVDFNFVLVNRYRSGDDHIGEHRDDEAELVSSIPIASLSFGAVRTFVLRHADSRSGRKRPASEKPSEKLDPVRLDLEHGSLLVMNAPTNRCWYHSVPPRKGKPGVRINLTFRQVDPALASSGGRKRPK